MRRFHPARGRSQLPRSADTGSALSTIARWRDRQNVSMICLVLATLQFLRCGGQAQDEDSARTSSRSYWPSRRSRDARSGHCLRRGQSCACERLALVMARRCCCVMPFPLKRLSAHPAKKTGRCRGRHD
jgi:hypothetical protein